MFICHVKDLRTKSTNLDSFLIVREFSDLFPKEISEMLLVRDVESSIDLESSKASISNTPYQMASIEMEEQKVQLEELIHKGYIRPSVSL